FAGTVLRCARTKLLSPRRHGARGRAQTIRGSVYREPPLRRRSEPPRRYRDQLLQGRRRSSFLSTRTRCGPTTALRSCRDASSASPSRSAACSRWATANSRSPTWRDGRRCGRALILRLDRLVARVALEDVGAESRELALAALVADVGEKDAVAVIDGFTVLAAATCASHDKLPLCSM